ncbi:MULTISPECIES: hypothetical protein [unclassified Granulicatella]|uniref:hypothetical protein n=1 Tax=unclassified Granulicatella TaxID=2630493 RepID=UPI00066BBF80|nr:MULTISPECIES: hypothetical protein [unclassified Granulicatella]
MALFKTKQTFHFEFEEIDNVNTTLIESFEELCDWVELENKRLSNAGGTGSVLVLKKGDRDEKVYSEVHIHFPFEKDTEEVLLPLVSSKGEKRKPVKETKDIKATVVEEKSPKKGSKKPLKEKSIKVKKERQPFNLNRLKVPLFVLCASGAIASGAIFLPGILKPKYETLIQKQEYVKAVEEYPENKEKIESMLFDKGQEGITDLEKYVQQTDSIQAKFDLAYLKQNFEKVVDLKNEATTPIRKTALAVSFVKLGMIDEAYELNQELGSNRLKQLIVEAYEVKAIEALKALDLKTAERIQDKIHQLTLQTKIEHVTSALNEENNLKNKLRDSSLSDEQKEASNKQLKQIQEKIEKIKKGVF